MITLINIQGILNNSIPNLSVVIMVKVLDTPIKENTLIPVLSLITLVINNVMIHYIYHRNQQAREKLISLTVDVLILTSLKLRFLMMITQYIIFYY